MGIGYWMWPDLLTDANSKIEKWKKNKTHTHARARMFIWKIQGKLSCDTKIETRSRCKWDKNRWHLYTCHHSSISVESQDTTSENIGQITMNVKILVCKSPSLSVCVCVCVFDGIIQHTVAWRESRVLHLIVSSPFIYGGNCLHIVFLVGFAMSCLLDIVRLELVQSLPANDFAPTFIGFPGLDWTLSLCFDRVVLNQWRFFFYHYYHYHFYFLSAAEPSNIKLHPG